MAELCGIQQKIAFIGLGNPGKVYARTRHNFGFIVVEEFARQHEWSMQEDRYFMAKVAKGRIQGVEVHLLLPLTFMNESGWSVKQYMDYFKLTIGQILVACDDTALEFGQLRLRPQGSSGGHNGLKSIAMHLGTEEFARLRLGIGNKMERQSLADYVLSDFTAEETPLLDMFVKNGAAVLEALVTEPITKVMSKVNTKLTM